jgi:phosphoenolpyruvate-protein kinase (PTS system EI component)
MSRYGRLWQRVSDIRDELKQLVSHATTNTLKDAEQTCSDAIITARDSGDAARAARIEDLLSAWADLEREMAACDD